MTLTLDFQGQTLKMLYLRNGLANWHGTKGMWVDWMLDPWCDFKLWPHPWPWHCQSLKYSKTWVSDHLAWATTLTWATIFSCTDAILVHFTLSPATTRQTWLVAYLEVVIYLLNATIILLQNTKLTVKFTRDGRPYPHLTPHCRWPGRLLFMAGSWLTSTTGSQAPCGLLIIAQLIALASLNVFSHVSRRKICSF